MRKELDTLQRKVKGFDVSTEYALSSSDTVAPTSDWVTVKPAFQSGKFIWVRNTLHTGYGDIILEPYTIGDGQEHIVSLSVQYIIWNDAYNPPSHDNDNWRDTAPTVSSGTYLWTRNKIVTTEETKYTDPVRLTGERGESGEGISIKGDTGDAGKGYDFIYYTTEDDSFDETPSSDVERTQNEYNAWCDYPAPVTETYKYIYMSMRTSNNNNWGNWSAPALMSSIGERGEDGEGFEFIFCQATSQTPPAFVDGQNLHTYTGTVNGKHFNDNDFIPQGWNDDSMGVNSTYRYEYACSRTKTNGQWSDFSSPSLWNIYSESSYTHIRYSPVNNPADISQTTTLPNSNTAYIGVYVDTNESETFSNYSWKKWIPQEGIDYDGRFLHVKFSNDEGTTINDTGGSYMGICYSYTKTAPTDGNAYTWSRIRGSDGAGMEFAYYSSASEQSELSAPTTVKAGTPQPNNWYERPYGVTEQVQYCYVSTKPTGGSSWGTPVLWAKYGATGQQGGTGERGEDGLGLEIIFKATADENTTPTFNNNENSSSYTGTIHNKKFQDDDFIPSGWSDDAMSPTETMKCVWASIRYKTIKNKSQGNKTATWDSFGNPFVWATYSEDGTGIDRVILEYAQTDNYTTSPTSGWSTTAPTYEAGKFYWTRQVIYYDDDPQTPHYTNPICVSGVDGTSVHFIYYCGSSTPTQPSDSSGVVINGSTSSDYRKWVEDPVSVTASNPYLFMSQSNDYDYSTGKWVNFSSPALISNYTTDGSGYEYAYYTTEKTTVPAKPTGTVTATTGTNKWTKTPVAVDSTYIYMYISYRTKTGSSYSAWSSTALWSKYGKDGEKGVQGVQGEKGAKGDKGDKGVDGIGLEHIFYRTQEPVTTWNANNDPSQWTVQPNTDDYYQSPWYDDAKGVDSTYKYEYCAIRTKTPNANGDGKWGAFSSPSLWSKYGDKGDKGDKGDAGTGYEYAYYVSDSTNLPTKPTGNVTATTGVKKWTTVPVNMDTNYKYMYISYRTTTNPTWSNTALWSRFGDKGIDGTDGTGVYRTSTEITVNPYSSDTYPNSRYRINKTSVNNDLGTTILEGDQLINGHYIYTIVLVGSTYYHLGERTELKGDKGDAGARGKDGIGLEHIFYRSKTEVTSWGNNNTNPAYWDANPSDDYHGQDLENNNWTDDATGVDETYQYEYCAIRTKTPSADGTGVWGKFGTPSLWAKYGEKGEKGDDGVSISNVVNHYLATSYTNVQKTNGAWGTWSTSIQTMNATNSLLWNYETIYGDDGSVISESNPVIIGRYGQNGAGIQSITEYYAVSNDNTNAPLESSFSTSVKTTTTSKRYLWNYEIIRYTDNSISYTPKRVISSHGATGDTGLTGVHGDSISSDTVLDKTTDKNFGNTSIGCVSNSVPSDFVANVVESEAMTRGSARCINSNYISSGGISVYRQGNIVTIHVNNMMLTSSFPYDTHTPVFNLPSWAKPNDIVYFPSVLDNSVLSVSNESSPKFRVRWLSNVANMSGTTTYIVDSEVNKLPSTLSWVSTSAINQGGVVQAKLLGNGVALEGAIVYFRVNGLVYARKTNENGIATLNINLPTGSYNIVAWYDGGKYDNRGVYEGQTGDYAYAELVNTNFSVSKASSVNVAWGSDDNGYYVRFTNNTGSYPIRYHKVSLNINDTGAFNVETDGDGKAYFRLTGMNGSITVSATMPSSNRVANSKSDSKTYTL